MLAHHNRHCGEPALYIFQPHPSPPQKNLQCAAHAAFYLSPLQGSLPEADVVDGFDAFAPGVDLSAVDVASGGGVFEEQGEG